MRSQPVTTMKTLHDFTTASMVLLLSLALRPDTHAAIPEPDNVIYGTIVISNTPVAKDRTDVVIQAQRMPGGQVIASYRMGSDPALGNFYSLKLTLESLPPLSQTNALQSGDSVNIVLTDSSGVVGQTTYQVSDRGAVQRVDFGAPVTDADGNGLPDLWELTYLDSVGGDPNALGANGQSAMQNFIAGTDPANPDDVFRVEIEQSGAQRAVWFVARKAEGQGYSGLTRRYTLQQVVNPGALSWQNVAGSTDVVGNNQTVSHQPSGTEAVILYRAMVELVVEGAIPNSLPDDWEIAMFGSAGQDPNGDPDHDGESTANEYISGTHPNNSNDVFRVTISKLGNQVGISFLARKAEGLGYAGLTRRYSLETKSNLGAPAWLPLPGETDIEGTNQTIALVQSTTNPASVYRARAELQ